MNNKEYIENVLKTESSNFFMEKVDRRLLHGIIGVSTEAGELLDALKKALFYGKSIDLVNIKEECGDLLWYISLIIKAVDGDYESIMATNIKKLQTRYPEKFSTEKALNRDLVAERKTLETL